MNKPVYPIVTMKYAKTKEDKVGAVLNRVFEKAMRNIQAKRTLTTGSTQKYTEVQEAVMA